MIKTEDPKYKSAFVTLSFYTILFFLIIIRYKIIPSGNGMMYIETVAPIILPLIVLIALWVDVLVKFIWRFSKFCKIINELNVLNERLRIYEQVAVFFISTQISLRNGSFISISLSRKIHK